MSRSAAFPPDGIKIMSVVFTAGKWTAVSKMESLHSAGAATVETEVLDLGNMDGRDTAEKAPNPTAILETLRESLTSRAKDLFDEKIDRFRLLEDVSGDAQIVRNLGKISNNDEDLRELFELMAKDNVDSSKVVSVSVGFSFLLLTKMRLFRNWPSFSASFARH